MISSTFFFSVRIDRSEYFIVVDVDVDDNYDGGSNVDHCHSKLKVVSLLL